MHAEAFTPEWFRSLTPRRTDADRGPFYDANMDAFDAAFEEGWALNGEPQTPGQGRSEESDRG